MYYYDIERGKLPITHPYYKEGSTALVNPLCRASGATSNIASYADKAGNQYLENPMVDFLAGADNFFENNDVGLLYAGYGLGLEEGLRTYSIGSANETQDIIDTLEVKKNDDYGYDVLANGSIVGGMSKIAPVIYFELIGGGGGGGGSYENTAYGSGGGGGGGCIRGLIDLSQISNIYYKVGVGGAGGTGGVTGTSGKFGSSSWISVVGEDDHDRLYASGGGRGTVYAGSAGGVGGDGGACYRSWNGSNITPGGLNSEEYQPGLYVLAAANGGWGGNGARGEDKPVTFGKGTNIGPYILAGKIIIHPSTTFNTSLKGPNGTDISKYNGYIAGGGGSSAVGQGGQPGIGGANFDGQWEQQDPSGGMFPGGGGGGACCASTRNDLYTGGNGANGRLRIKYAYMRAPFWGVINTSGGNGGGSNIDGGDIINPGPGFEETIK